MSALQSISAATHCGTMINFGKTHDAHPWATETMGNFKYPLELFLRLVTVELETMKLVKGLPQLAI